VIAPAAVLAGSEDGFDLVLHFHGHDPARKELVKSALPIVLAGYTLDLGRSYGSRFSGESTVLALIADVERAVSELAGRTLQARHVGITAWSAGYEAVRAVLHQRARERIDSYALIDGLHTPRDRGAAAEQLQDFVQLSERAARKEALFIVTHSAIDPPSFTSTTETAHYLISALGAKPLRVERRDPLGLELTELFSAGDFHVRGYAGNDKADHCAQFGTYGDVLRAFHRRWRGEPAPLDRG
jgi:hypothetical protein